MLPLGTDSARTQQGKATIHDNLNFLKVYLQSTGFGSMQKNQRELETESHGNNEA